MPAVIENFAISIPKGHQIWKRARISEDGLHRYSLSRIWSSSPMILFIGVNPSTADEFKDDRTIMKCIKFAETWGYGGMYMGNLFSFRTKDTKILLKNRANAIGPECDERLVQMILLSKTVVCAWGSWKFLGDRPAQILQMIEDPKCLYINKDGQPKHPLYCAGSLELKPYIYARPQMEGTI